jgi:3-isopropylmalate/(R)-2-methylmalate dehydratase large subunit
MTVTPQTIAEKVLSRQNTQGLPVCAGDLIDARLDGLMVQSYRWVRLCYEKMGFIDGPPVVWDHDRVFLMNEHVQPPPDVGEARSNYKSKLDAARLGLTHFYESEMGVCHQMMLDYGLVRPGEMVVGNDSHAVAYGGINAVSTGIGTDEAAFAWAFGELFFTVPESIKVVLRGEARPYPFGKDVILYLAGQFSDSFAQNRAIEFHGPLASDMNISTRLTIADHAVEVGAKFGVFLCDEKTRAFVDARTSVPYSPVAPDDGAHYIQEIDVDCDTIGFQIAKPFRFDNVAPVAEVAGVKIDQARIGSCANGRFEDIEIAARMLEGRKVAPGVRFYVSPASMTVYKECVNAGLVSTLLEAGVQFMEPGCSICQTPGIVLNEEVCITSTTRNYHGRFGGSTCSEAQIYLGGPATVTAAAIAGEIIDPTELLRV